MVRKRKKSQQRKRIIRYSLLGIVILSLIFLLLLFFESGFFDFVKRVNSEPRLIVVKDECSLILGTLIHNLKSESECKLKCTNECEYIDLDFYDIEFISNLEDCNICNCYCH